ncbi:MAG: hypothetical protein HOP19_14840, partial [Acidobacteria bacterium]|nr:hypothetical protein [Acidobacteriota bacterium]
MNTTLRNAKAAICLGLLSFTLLITCFGWQFSRVQASESALQPNTWLNRLSHWIKPASMPTKAATAPVAASAMFASITVNDNGTAVANDGKCTLIEAIIAANTDTASGGMSGECSAGGGADTIDLPANATISLTAAHNNFYGPNGLPAITSVITINGNGTTIERGTGAPNFRLFYVSGGSPDVFNTAGNLTLRNVT